MGSYDSAQIDVLKNIYILDSFGRMIDLNKVDIWGCTVNTDPKTSKINQKIIRAFKLLGLKIEISSHLKIVNFHVITFFN